jgi:hypothetical protein
MKNNCEVTEGSILFEKVNKPVPMGLFFFVFFLCGMLTIVLPKLETLLLIAGGIIMLVLGIINIGYYYEGRKNGFEDETYKCFYFDDKLVFHRISNQLDENYTKGKTTDELNEELNQLLKTKKRNDDSDWKIDRLEEAIFISKNKRKPHIIEVPFSELDCFMLGKDDIIEIKNRVYSNTFYQKVGLTKEYKKCQNQIVDFLNKKIREAKN